MNWKVLLNGALTAAASGGAMATGVLIIDPMHMNWIVLAQVFLAGAVLGVLNWLRKNPWHQAEVEAAQNVQRLNQ